MSWALAASRAAISSNQPLNGTVFPCWSLAKDLDERHALFRSGERDQLFCLVNDQQHGARRIERGITQLLRQVRQRRRMIEQALLELLDAAGSIRGARQHTCNALLVESRAPSPAGRATPLACATEEPDPP